MSDSNLQPCMQFSGKSHSSMMLMLLRNFGKLVKNLKEYKTKLYFTIIVSEMFVRSNVHSAKRPSAKCPFGKMSFGKMSYGKGSFGKMSGHQENTPSENFD
jgi:hypothetical protein